MRSAIGTPILDRLAAKSHFEDGPLDTPCQVWDGKRYTVRPYGIIVIEGRSVRVHRAAWIARHGEIPPDKPYVLHRCDNPPCFADDHLWIGTDLENIADREAKGRNYQANKTHCKWGHHLDTYAHVDRFGHRHCRPCNARRQAERKAARTRT